jgi:predicted kinase
MRVIIMRGVPGSGKSRYVATKHPNAVVYSADSFFMQPNDAGELVYQFNPAQLGEAHDECFRDFLFACSEVQRVRRVQGMNFEKSTLEIVVDNTNTRLFEMSPYVMVARRYGYPIRIVHVVADPEECAKRNVHGVPLAAIKRMADNFEPTLPFWGAEEETYTWLGD